jgi:hypothetical protein
MHEASNNGFFGAQNLSGSLRVSCVRPTQNLNPDSSFSGNFPPQTMVVWEPKISPGLSGSPESLQPQHRHAASNNGFLGAQNLSGSLRVSCVPPTPEPYAWSLKQWFSGSPKSLWVSPGPLRHANPKHEPGFVIFRQFPPRPICMKPKPMVFREPKISPGLSGSPESPQPKIWTRIRHFPAI